MLTRMNKMKDKKIINFSNSFDKSTWMFERSLIVKKITADHPNSVLRVSKPLFDRCSNSPGFSYVGDPEEKTVTVGGVSETFSNYKKTKKGYLRNYDLETITVLEVDTELKGFNAYVVED